MRIEKYPIQFIDFLLKKMAKTIICSWLPLIFHVYPIIRKVSGTEKGLWTKRLRNGSCSISWPRKAYFLVSLLPTQDSSTASPLAAVFETRNFFFISFPQHTGANRTVKEPSGIFRKPNWPEEVKIYPKSIKKWLKTSSIGSRGYAETRAKNISHQENGVENAKISKGSKVNYIWSIFSGYLKVICPSVLY